MMAASSYSTSPSISPPPIPPDPPPDSAPKMLTDPCSKTTLPNDLSSGPVGETTLDTGNLKAKEPEPALDVCSLEKFSSTLTTNSVMVTNHPYEVPSVNGDEKILQVESLPLDMNYESISREFGKHGTIKEIRLRLAHSFDCWQVWVVFSSHTEALKAFSEHGSSVDFRCSLTNKAPSTGDVYYPPVRGNSGQPGKVSRSPMPPTWLIATTKGDHANLYAFRNLLKAKAGDMDNSRITRFGRSSFLIHAKSTAQATMLTHLRVEPDSIIKEIKPHYNFSYAKGVIFNRDLYDLPEDEILEMCEDKVWKVYKIPRSSMIVVTFRSEMLPPHIFVDRERINIRPYKQRPLQCYNCFGYGHASRRCTSNKICVNCSHYEHGDCDRSAKCVNCKEEHCAKDKTCSTYKREQEAVLKAAVDKISIGHAKKLLLKSSYSDVLRQSSSVDHSTSSAAANKTSASPSVEISLHPTLGVPRTSSGTPQASSGAHRSSSGPPRSSSGATQASLGATRASSEATQASSVAPRASFEASQSDSLLIWGPPLVRV